MVKDKINFYSSVSKAITESTKKSEYTIYIPEEVKMNITHETKEVTREGIIDILLKKNGYEYNLHKASEELQELALVITQKLTKPHKINDQEIIDEIGDCEIRIAILRRIFNSDKIDARIAYKLKKFQEYHDSDKYTHI